MTYQPWQGLYRLSPFLSSSDMPPEFVTQLIHFFMYAHALGRDFPLELMTELPQQSAIFLLNLAA